MSATWGARCGKSARRVLLGGTGTRRYAGSVRTLARKGQLQRGSAKATAPRLVPTSHSIPHDKLMACLRMRIADRSVLKLIGMWLKAPVVGADDPTQSGRRKKGTPQGGIISPLLANLFLHWFDKVFHRWDGPAIWAKAKLVRYADDFVVLARCQGPTLREFIESKLETWMGLEINRDKTRVVELKVKGTSLDFLGYTFRYDRDLKGRAKHYLNVCPSKKALKSERQRLREMTNSGQCFKPLPGLIEQLNEHLTGWANYFSFGYPRAAYYQIDQYVRQRLTLHLRRRSQRPFRPPKGVPFSRYLDRGGLIRLAAPSSSTANA